MSIMDEKEKIKQKIDLLTEKINRYNQAFFQEGQSLINDYEYDQLVEELVACENDFPMYKRVDSPTQRIGEAPSTNFPNVAHKYPLYSLSNTYQEEEVNQFIIKAVKGIGNSPVDFVCELKIDGLALNIVYNKKKLQHIITRGDGQQGDNITINRPLIKNIPHTLPADSIIPDYLEIRGEAFMPKLAFETLNKHYQKEGKQMLSNPRNAAAGILRSKHIDDILLVNPPLAFCPYSLLGENLYVTHQQQVLCTLETWGFSLYSHYQYCADLGQIMQYIHYWHKQKATLPMAIDGIVIKVNDLQQQKILGETAKSPRWAVAYKYKPDSTSTILQNVAYQVGRTGVVTPVAVLQPVHLAGTIVKRASLYNAQEIARLNLHIGDTISIEKGGDVIPKVTAVDTTKRNSQAQPVLFPTHCPACHSPLEKMVSEAQHYCLNTHACIPQRKGNIIHFLGKKAMNMTSIGPKTIDLLFDKKLIQRPVDLFYLTQKHLQTLDGFKEKSIANILQSIEHAKRTPFERVLFALGIRHVGFTVAYKLVQHFHNIDKLMTASLEDLVAVPEIGEKIADSIIAYFSMPESLKQIEEMRTLGLSFHTIQPSTTIKSSSFSGKVFIVSGILDQYTREEIHNLIEKNGGVISTTMSRKVHYFIVGKKPSMTKIAKAQTLDIPMLSEKELDEMIQ